MIYLDSSALLKLVFQERESDALQDWLDVRVGVPTVSSELSKVEVLRACRRIDVSALADARSMLGQLDFVPLSGAVVDLAGDVDGTNLRSLDSLQLASALLIRADLSAFVAYDHRLLEAAAQAGLATYQPRA